jgi:hypothetical protein
VWVFFSSRHSFSMSLEVARALGNGLGRISAGGAGWRLGEAEVDVTRARSRDHVLHRRRHGRTWRGWRWHTGGRPTRTGPAEDEIRRIFV